MYPHTADELLYSAVLSCKYAPLISFDTETGMIQIWDFNADYEEALFRKDYCRGTEIDLDELFQRINDNCIFYSTTLKEAYNYGKGKDNITR